MSYTTYMTYFPFFSTVEVAFTLGYPANAGWIAPFGNRRITGCWLLPDEYRCLLRPSSA
jgi:hypothetical protein